MYKKAWIYIICATLLLMLLPIAPVHAVEITRLVVDSYDFQESTDTEGVFDLTLHLRNTSKSRSVKSVLITLSGDNDGIYPVYGESNQKYIDSVKANTTITVVYRMRIADTFTDDVLRTVVGMQYADEDDVLTSNSFTIYLPNSGKLSFESIQVSVNAAVSTKTRVTFTCLNQGESIENIQFTITGSGLLSDVTLSGVGIQRNQKYNAEMYIVFKDAGEQEITLSYQYTDKDGNPVNGEIQTLNATVAGNRGDNPGVEDGQPIGLIQDLKQQLIQLSIIAALIIIAVVILIIEYKHRDRR